MWWNTRLWRWLRWTELWYVTNKNSVGACTFVSEIITSLQSICNVAFHDKTDVNFHSLHIHSGTQQAVTSLPYDWLFTFQTVGGIRSRRHVLWEVRTQKKGSFPGRSASMSKISVMCVERPSSVHAGWSLLPTVCKMTAGQGSILL